jgi:hypothetical protein
MVMGFQLIHDSMGRNIWFWTFTFGLIVAVTDFFTIGWLGMWVGLSTKQSNRAFTGVVSRVLLVPWLLFIAIGILLILPAFQRVVPESPYFYLGIWFALSVVNNVLLVIWSRSRLYEDFRNFALNRGEKGGYLRFWRWLGKTWGAKKSNPKV